MPPKALPAVPAALAPLCSLCSLSSPCIACSRCNPSAACNAPKARPLPCISSRLSASRCSLCCLPCHFVPPVITAASAVAPAHAVFPRCRLLCLQLFGLHAVSAASRVLASLAVAATPALSAMPQGRACNSCSHSASTAVIAVSSALGPPAVTAAPALLPVLAVPPGLARRSCSPLGRLQSLQHLQCRCTPPVRSPWRILCLRLPQPLAAAGTHMVNILGFRCEPQGLPVTEGTWY